MKTESRMYQEAKRDLRLCKKYLHKMLENCHIENSKPVATPKKEDLQQPPPEPGLPDQLAKLHQSAIGSLIRKLGIIKSY